MSSKTEAQIASRKRSAKYHQKRDQFMEADAELRQVFSDNRNLFKAHPKVKPLLFASINDYKQNQKSKTTFLTWVTQEVKRLRKLPVEGIKNVSANNLCRLNSAWNQKNCAVRKDRIAYGYKA